VSGLRLSRTRGSRAGAAALVTKRAKLEPDRESRRQAEAARQKSVTARSSGGLKGASGRAGEAAERLARVGSPKLRKRKSAPQEAEREARKAELARQTAEEERQHTPAVDTAALKRSGRPTAGQHRRRQCPDGGSQRREERAISRGGKVAVPNGDPASNGQASKAVPSLRARAPATVVTPLRWNLVFAVVPRLRRAGHCGNIVRDSIRLWRGGTCRRQRRQVCCGRDPGAVMARGEPSLYVECAWTASPLIHLPWLWRTAPAPLARSRT